MSEEEFFQLQEERIVSMTSDFIQTLPPGGGDEHGSLGIKDEYLEHVSRRESEVEVGGKKSGEGEPERKKGNSSGSVERNGMKEIEI